MSFSSPYFKKWSLLAVTCLSAYALCAGYPLRAQAPANGALPTPRFVTSPEGVEQKLIRTSVKEMFAKKDFAGLDQRARELRKEARIYSNGAWALTTFYSALDDMSDKAPDSEWMAHIATIKQWMGDQPSSITPRVALARVLTSYAWKARGLGYGDTVTKEGGQLMASRLKEAREILFAARSLDEKCPRWWPVAQGVALGEGWDAETYAKLCEEGIAAYPDNFAIYLNKAHHLQPRWYGKPGEWETYAIASADRLGGEKGDILYAQMIWYLSDRNLFKKNIFAASGVQWERVKRSFQVLQEKYPDSLTVTNEYARMACYAGDWPTARGLFEKIGDRADPAVWSKLEHFVTFRNDAYSN
jgi:hypothetical protein